MADTGQSWQQEADGSGDGGDIPLSDTPLLTCWTLWEMTGAGSLRQRHRV